MRRTNRNSHEVANLGINIALWFVEAGGMEAHSSFGDEEGLIVHFVPMRWRAGCVRRDDELGGAETIVYLSFECSRGKIDESHAST